MLRNTPHGAVGVFLLVGALAVGALRAQEPSTQPADPRPTNAPAGANQQAEAADFGEEVDVTVVNVDVRVRDKDGNPIHGLRSEDFELYEDGRPVTITNFYEVRDGYKQLPEPLEGDATAASEPAATEPDQPLFLAVYIDNFNIRPFNRNRVFRRVREFLQTTLDDEDLTMLVSYDRTLHVRTPFTTDRNLLLGKLQEMERFTGHAVTGDADRRQVMREIDEAVSETYAVMAAETFAESTLSDLKFSIRALQDFIDQLAGVRGRKALLHVSDGMPLRAGESVFHVLERKYSTSSVHLTALNYDATREFRAAASAAAANDITFYTLDAAGLRAPSGLALQSMTGAGSSAMVDSVYIRNHQQPLRLLAEETGGFAILNTNDVGPGLSKMRTDLDHYYSLGYSPSGTVSGRGHRLKVEVAGQRKAAIRHRKSYREQTLAQRMEDETLAALRFGLEENAFGASLQVAEMRERDDGLFDVTAWLQIPVTELSLLPGAETHQGRLTLYVSALDDEGGVSDVANLQVPIELPSEDMPELQELAFPYRLELRMRSGPHRVAVGIRDELAARSGYLSREIMVGRVE